LNSPMIFNHENWGLSELELQETVPVHAGRQVLDPARLRIKPE